VRGDQRVDAHPHSGREATSATWLLAASYQAASNGVIVVRPDGYIAMRSDTPRAFLLDAYLARTTALARPAA
jgi:hypothetical protein